jgi:hypothetical protein
MATVSDAGNFKYTSFYCDMPIAPTAFRIVAADSNHTLTSVIIRSNSPPRATDVITVLSTMPNLKTLHWGLEYAGFSPTIGLLDIGRIYKLLSTHTSIKSVSLDATLKGVPPTTDGNYDPQMDYFAFDRLASHQFNPNLRVTSRPKILVVAFVNGVLGQWSEAVEYFVIHQYTGWAVGITGACHLPGEADGPKEPKNIGESKRFLQAELGSVWVKSNRQNQGGRLGFGMSEALHVHDFDRDNKGKYRD